MQRETRECQGQNTPNNRSVLTVPTSSDMKKSDKGRCATAPAKTRSATAPFSQCRLHPAVRSSGGREKSQLIRYVYPLCFSRQGLRYDDVYGCVITTMMTLNPFFLLGSTSASGGGGRKTTLSVPGGVKAECSNCGAAHMPLWR
jgi:GATA-binding protein, other eukaryote